MNFWSAIIENKTVKKIQKFIWNKFDKVYSS